MVADLLELHQHGQDIPAPVDPGAVLDLFHCVFDDRLVQGGLLFGQRDVDRRRSSKDVLNLHALRIVEERP